MILEVVMKLALTFILGLTFPISAVQARAFEKSDLSSVNTAAICPIQATKALAGS